VSRNITGISEIEEGERTRITTEGTEDTEEGKIKEHRPFGFAQGKQE
jgi:hypothetical protein